jgi:hypothetical protein
VYARWLIGKLIERRPFAEDSSAQERGKAMPSTALFVHVPVDSVEIVDGPGSTWVTEIIPDYYERLTGQDHTLSAISIEVALTLRTDASGLTFRRKLKLTAFGIGVMVHFASDSLSLNRDCPFTARFSGHNVSGYYNPQERKGHFRCLT